MYADKIIKRINNINWKLVGANKKIEFRGSVCEFLKRMAYFFYETSLTPTSIIFVDIAKLLGDEEKIDIDDYCNEEVKEITICNLGIKLMIEYYIHLGKYVEKNNDALKYLSIYEPLIKVLENGGKFLYKPKELEVYGDASYPLNNWYNKFLKLDCIKNIENS